MSGAQDARPGHRPPGAAADSRPLELVGQILSDGFSLSFAALAGTLLYFDLRARHEGEPSRDWDAPERP